MISAFQSRNFGCGMKPTLEELSIANQYRKNIKPTYSEQESVLKIRGKCEKEDLNGSPIVLYFHLYYILSMVLHLAKKAIGLMITCHAV